MSDAREALEKYASADTSTPERPMSRRDDFAPEAFAALRAVLDLHKPITEDTGWTTSHTICNTCRYDEGLDTYAWPCPTVAAITKKLAKALELLDRYSTSSMGGTPDLFAPDCGCRCNHTWHDGFPTGQPCDDHDSWECLEAKVNELRPPASEGARG